MNIRKLTDPCDLLESERVIATAFLHPWDEEDARRKADAQARGMAARHEESWGLFDEGGTMLTSISTLRHHLSFGGESMSVGEVHMVGSLPEHRGGGGVRALMGEVLRDFRERGDALAVLIPFSCSFYRKFGFELAGRMVKQRLAIEQLSGFSCDLRVTRVWDKEDLDAVRELWGTYARRYDLVELRDDTTWEWRGNGEFGDPDFLHPERQRYTYVLWNADNDPCAYVRFSFVHEPDMPFVGELEVSELVWDGPLALRAALGFLYRMRAKVSHINATLPHVEFATIVPEEAGVEQQVDSHVMARMLEVERLVGLMPQPYDAGSYVLRIDDDFMPEAGGTWKVAYEDGHACSVTQTDREPDLIVPQTTACQLVLGRINLADALLKPTTTVLDNSETLGRVFVRRPVHLSI